MRLAGREAPDPVAGGGAAVEGKGHGKEGSLEQPASGT